VPQFTLRFDLRNPDFAGTTTAERYRAALDIASWADGLGFTRVGISEHHGVPDGYLPSPCTFAAALAACTRHMRIAISALVAPMHDPLRLAEDLAVVDNLSGGRLDIVVANGYVESELAMFGCALRDRPKRTVEVVETLRKAWTGEPFDYRGRRVQITPVPCQPGGPAIVLGGKSDAAARRAARIADGFQPSNPNCWGAYRDEMVRLGKPDPGPMEHTGHVAFVHLTRDPDRRWEDIAPYALHETNSYGRWLADAGLIGPGSYAPVDDAAELRASGRYRTLTPEAFVEELSALGPDASVAIHPLMGGIPPELAWESLHLLEHEVLPRVSGRGEYGLGGGEPRG